ncbi:MAG: DUF2294 domain-containing protein [Thermodesulfobacteriota bacterium]|nr:DUF2294 domain-containing protein [Thermodesulfobacteriota bacterium]
MEDEISRAIIKFEREHMGRGPKEVKTCIMGDIIFIRLKGVLTPAEQQLAKNEGGIELIKKVRANLIENSKSFLEQIISKITKNELISMHTDISTVTGERVILFILPENFEEKFK